MSRQAGPLPGSSGRTVVCSWVRDHSEFGGWGLVDSFCGVLQGTDSILGMEKIEPS